jgi:hypothetical protein
MRILSVPPQRVGGCSDAVCADEARFRLRKLRK